MMTAVDGRWNGQRQRSMGDGMDDDSCRWEMEWMMTAVDGRWNRW